MVFPKLSPAENVTYTLLKYFIMSIIIVAGLTLPFFAKQQDNFLGKVLITFFTLTLIGVGSFIAVKVLFFFGGRKNSISMRWSYHSY